MQEEPKKMEYIDENLSDCDFTGQDLNGVRFCRCEFNRTLFLKAQLNDAEFNHCKGEGTIFNRAQMRRVRIDNCTFRKSQFENANIFDAQITGLDVSHSVMLGCRFNKSKIDALNISRCNMSMASFLDTQILTVIYEPVLRYGARRGIRLLKPGGLLHNHIFMNGNQHLDFADYCYKEAIKEKLYANVDRKGLIARLFAIPTLWLFGLVSDYGQSFARWLLFVAIIIAAFAALQFSLYDLSVLASVENSLRAFFSINLATKDNSLFLTETIFGYFMLGVLISLLTNKLQLN